jgi:hypothetical protein
VQIHDTLRSEKPTACLRRERLSQDANPVTGIVNGSIDAAS